VQTAGKSQRGPLRWTLWPYLRPFGSGIAVLPLNSTALAGVYRFFLFDRCFGLDLGFAPSLAMHSIFAVAASLLGTSRRQRQPGGFTHPTSQ
jgi:hypothetical protein